MGGDATCAMNICMYAMYVKHEREDAKVGMVKPW
jgi:hypothetical protein